MVKQKCYWFIVTVTVVFLDNNHLNKYVMQYELSCTGTCIISVFVENLIFDLVAYTKLNVTLYHRILQNNTMFMFNVCRYTWGKVREGGKKVMDLLYYKHWSSPIFDPRTNTDIFKLLKHNKHQLNELHLPPSTSPYIIVLLNTKQYRNR